MDTESGRNRCTGRSRLDDLLQAYRVVGEEAFSGLFSSAALLGVGDIGEVLEQPPAPLPTDDFEEVETLSIAYGTDQISDLVGAPRRGGDALLAQESNIDLKKCNVETSRVTDVLWFLPHRGEPLNLGRRPNNEVLVPEASISAVHCRFNWKGTWDVTIEDLGSRNGVWVDGRRLEAADPYDLAGGETVLVGTVLFRFFYADGVRQLLAERNSAAERKERPGFFKRIFGGGGK